MNFWKRSIRQVRPVHRDPARSRRAPSRSCRLQLEDLEGRALLSTWTLAEYLDASSARHVVEQFNNSPPSDITITGNPTPTFVLNTESAVPDTVYIQNTSAGVPIKINGHNQDTINLGSAGSVQGFLAPVTLDNPSSHNTIWIFDDANPTARTATLFTSTPGWGEVAGLAPAPIIYNYDNTSSVNIVTGTGNDTVNVQATGAPTFITNRGYDMVNVGNAGTVQGIHGALSISNPPLANTITINDSTDPTARTATLFTSTPGWGEVAGLAPAPIIYNYDDTSSVNIVTGTGNDTVNVAGTGATTYITGHGYDTVNVGTSGTVQGIHGSLFVNDKLFVNKINIDDSADAVPRTATLSTYTHGWGEVSGLAPAPIIYNYATTSSMNLTTNTAGDTIDVWATGVATYISTPKTGTYGGFDTVNIGYEGTVQGIHGPLYISNRPNYTAVNINDWTDTGERHASLGSLLLGPDYRTWGSIGGLAPVAINFVWNDMYHHQVNVSAPLGGNISWTVNPDAYESAVGVYVLLDGSNIN